VIVHPCVIPVKQFVATLLLLFDVRVGAVGALNRRGPTGLPSRRPPNANPTKKKMIATGTAVNTLVDNENRTFEPPRYEEVSG
jgi:hypothetical protein